jgi:hypothetical protein
VGDLLRNFGAMIPLTIIALPYALIAWPLLTAYRRRRRPARAASITAAIDVTIVLLASLVLCLVLMPIAGSNSSTLDLIPGSDVMTALGDEDSCWQVGGNLLMLSPLGALLPLRTPWLRSVLRITVAALIASMLVEGMQYLIHAGRVTATDDVLLNTIGASAGATASRRWWPKVRLVPVPPMIPAQTRRALVLQPAAYTRRMLHPVCPNMVAVTATGMQNWRRPNSARPSSTRNAS